MSGLLKFLLLLLEVLSNIRFGLQRIIDVVCQQGGMVVMVPSRQTFRISVLQGVVPQMKEGPDFKLGGNADMHAMCGWIFITRFCCNSLKCR